MDQIFDLFGDPVPEGRGKRGRPQHIATQENRNKVSMLLALGWSNERIAAALRCTLPTLRKHYFSELKFRDVARDRLDAKRAMIVWAEVEKGNVAAMREFERLLEKNDTMGAERRVRDGEGDEDESPRAAKLGKKEEAARLAETAGAGTDWGSDLLPATENPAKH